MDAAEQKELTRQRVLKEAKATIDVHAYRVISMSRVKLEAELLNLQKVSFTSVLFSFLAFLLSRSMLLQSLVLRHVQALDQEAVWLTQAASGANMCMLLDLDRRYYETRLKELSLIYQLLGRDVNDPAGPRKKTMLLNQKVGQIINIFKLRNAHLAKRICIAENNLLQRISTHAHRTELCSLLATQQNLVGMLLPLRAMAGARDELLVQSARWVAGQYDKFSPGQSDLATVYAFAKSIYAKHDDRPSNSQAKVESDEGSLTSRHGPARLGLEGVGGGVVLHDEFDSPSLALSHFGLRGIKAYLGDFSEVLIIQDLPDNSIMSVPSFGKGQILIRPLLWTRSLMLEILSRKLVADSLGAVRHSLSETVLDNFLMQWPIRTLAEIHVLELLHNLHHHRDQPLCNLFGRLLGLHAPLNSHYLDFMLFLVACLQLRRPGNDVVLRMEQCNISYAVGTMVLSDAARGQPVDDLNTVNASLTKLFQDMFEVQGGFTVHGEFSHHLARMKMEVDTYLLEMTSQYALLIRGYCRKLYSGLKALEASKRVSAIRKRRNSLSLTQQTLIAREKESPGSLSKDLAYVTPKTGSMSGSARRLSVLPGVSPHDQSPSLSLTPSAGLNSNNNRAPVNAGGPRRHSFGGPVSSTSSDQVSLSLYLFLPFILRLTIFVCLYINNRSYISPMY